MANDDHIAQLMKGEASWNAWRREHPDVRPDLREADLSGQDLRGADLGEADLRNANLGEATLSSANLWRAALSDADLYRANLREANLGARFWSTCDQSKLTVVNASKTASGRHPWGLWESRLIGRTTRNAREAAPKGNAQFSDRLSAFC
jgi:hypothetical protein